MVGLEINHEVTVAGLRAEPYFALLIEQKTCILARRTQPIPLLALQQLLLAAVRPNLRLSVL